MTCTCGSAGAAFVPRDHYADCPEAQRCTRPEHKCRDADAGPCNGLPNYTHSSENCPVRINASTYAETMWVHGPCKEKPVASGPEIDFTFTAGSKEYHITGDMQSIEKKAVGYSPSGTEKITLELWGTVETRAVHSEPHFGEGDGRHKFCKCSCSKCLVRTVGSGSDWELKCACADCSCGG